MHTALCLAPRLLQEAQHGAAREGGGGGPLTIDGGLVIWTLVVFGLLLLVLRTSVWPVLLAAVRDREKKLEKMLADAARDREAAAALLAEHKALLATAHTEAQQLIAQAHTVADKERETLLTKAREEYDQLLERARHDIDAEKEKAIVALRREAVDLSIAAASKLLEAQLDSETNRKLVMDYLAQLETERAR